MSLLFSCQVVSEELFGSIRQVTIMKLYYQNILLLICIFLMPVFSFSQDASENLFRINKIPPQGILLDKGWKFRAGDDSTWANPDFDDREWQPINPTLDIRHIPQLQQTSFYWFRLKLQVDSSLLNQPLGIMLSQVGASEIYLDGKLLYKLGNIDFKNNEITTHHLLQRPFIINLNSNQTQVLAIRYAYDPKSFLVMLGNPNFCFNALLNTTTATLTNFRSGVRLSEIYETGVMAVWLLLTIFSFCFYFLYRTQVAYMYTGLGGFCVFFGRFISHSVHEMPGLSWNTNWISIGILISSVFTMLSNIFAINTICSLFGQRRSKFYYAQIFFGLFATLSFIFLYEWAGFLWLISILLSGTEILRLSIKALRNKRPGATVVICSTSIWLILLILGIVSLNSNLNTAYFLLSVAPITYAIGWSIIIAYEFARTGLALRSRVKEVEELSQEKHRILSEQNIVLEKQVEQRTSALNNSLQELKSTQSQLIHREKMASLGELTAGIAHEIQNPLNFVNNFSEVNKELLVEMKDELDKGNIDEVKTIANDVIDNEEKILHHGKRADAIVKGMLQHSRTSTGQKEPTDINALADEYLRLSYHGMRAKDKTFNATLKTDFDNSIGKINIVPQDIGRVLLNLFNNAFYTTDEKKKTANENYQPTVSIQTKKIKDKVEVKVSDNGTGIPQKVVDKIFQPFFTTKPTGQGTGLGLSLSYDIIKAHGGEIKVETKEGVGSEFIILLPT